MKDKIYVRSHYRTVGQWKPWWIAILWDGDNRYKALTARKRWTTNLSKAGRFFKRDLTKKFKQEIEHGTVLVFKVK